MDKISVLTPTFNRITHLQELIWLFQHQDHENKELIILNDNPMIEFVCEEPNVFVYNVPKMNSLGQLRNKLMDLATGDFIHFWDDDDVRDKDALSKLYKSYIERPDGMLASGFRNYVYWENYKPVGITKDGGNHLFFGLFSREYFSKYKFHDKLHLGEDQDFVGKGKTYIYQTLSERTPIAYCWGNDVFHVSGNSLDLWDEKQQIERKRLFEHKHGNISDNLIFFAKKKIFLKPIIRYDYFGEFEYFFTKK